MTSIVHVPLPGREYDIHIGAGLIGQAGALVGPLLRQPRVAVVADETVAGLHLEALVEGFAAGGVTVRATSLPSGEGTKGWEGLQACLDWLLEMKVERGDLVVAFGGGVVGDLVGFAAAILRRGVGFVQVPTTLLAQVDSSVGGKTGINTRQGKNLVGAFHQPRLVLADTDLLGTLPARDFLAGYGEVMKYGLLGDAGFFTWLEHNAPGMADGNAAARREAVRRCCEMKAAIVLRDETEQGDRALLNLGHTFGHALEAATGYSDRLLHGEGVAIGCALAFDLSARMGLCAQETPGRVRAHLAQMGMKRSLADIPGPLPDVDGLIALMGQDKKVRDGRLTFILARDIGAAYVEPAADATALRAVLADALAERL
ncbi:3-dehydroquinate synthase [Paroceanicella profunda]|uniref:3-dehydroquinate synthase n=1 Tax=Paroceanicella profunda TaxID=2579971 RepID=A0A5B8G1F9_9RHOB|nr:3-dehydroquinate synthase [Paroceanicella profunda]QDL92912.1 3-dehydroquinate synthase [Paroceanicella profunda]